MKTLHKISNPNIVLVNPPFYRFITFAYAYNPLGIRYISSYLKQHGYNCQLFNFDFPKTIDPKEPDYPEYQEDFGLQYKKEIRNPDHTIWKEVEQTFLSSPPDILGITLMTPQFETAIITAKIAKKINPECIVVFGGIHPTIFPEESLAHPEVDFIVKGEGELTTLELVNALVKHTDIKSVNGIVYKDQTNKVIYNQSRELLKDLDAIPFPDENLSTPQERELMMMRGSIYTSRGCPFQCTFCARKPIWGKRVRYRSPENVVKEIQHYYEHYGTRFFMFEDDTLTLRFDRIKRMLEMILEQKMKISYTIQTKVTFIKPELLTLLKKTGCTSVALGIESGSQYTLDRIKKGITLDECRNAVKLSKEYGIRVNSFFIVGYPWDTPELIDETEAFIKELDSNVSHLYLFTPLPGCELFEEIHQSGKLIAKEWSDYYFQNPNVFAHDTLDNKWLYHRFLDMKKSINDSRHLSLKYESRSPKYILNKVMENIRSPKRLFYLGKRFIKLQTDNKLKKV